MSKTISLIKPIEAHGKTLTEITLRDPTGKDIAACGVPQTYHVKAGGNAIVSQDAGAIHAYISTLAAIPPSSVDKLSAPDFMALSDVVVGFFVPPALVKPEAGAPAAIETLPTS